MASVTSVTRRYSSACNAQTGETGGRYTPSPPKGALGGVTTDPLALADRLGELAERVERLTPSPRRPEGFFEDRSEIAHELREAARLAARRARRG